MIGHDKLRFGTAHFKGNEFEERKHAESENYGQPHIQIKDDATESDEDMNVDEGIEVKKGYEMKTFHSPKPADTIKKIEKRAIAAFKSP